MATSVKSGRSASPKMMRSRISPFSKLLNQVATGLRQSPDDFSQVKLMLQIDGHLAADVIENLRDPAQMFDELFKLFKVTKTDIDLLEDLVRDAGRMMDFQEGLKEFKRESRYESIEPSPERNAHAIADKLEKLLHNGRYCMFVRSTVFFTVPSPPLDLLACMHARLFPEQEGLTQGAVAKFSSGHASWPWRQGADLCRPWKQSDTLTSDLFIRLGNFKVFDNTIATVALAPRN
ncbi:uncharacterized protein [Branchiostoma lanceolatum]|uniref:uncharacterized protein n=1 Tax=Branchiostoma lanceolatum TaxID=7740 RepID=UPI003452B2B9